MKSLLCLVLSAICLPLVGLCQSNVRVISSKSPTLEGVWELVSPALKNENKTGQPGLTDDNNNSSTNNGNQANERDVIQYDSTVTILPDGTTRTTIFTRYRNTQRVRRQSSFLQQSNVMHKNEVPSLRFFGDFKSFSGFTGCNKIWGAYSISAQNTIDFSRSAPSTKMPCMGEFDETKFMNALHQVNRFVIEKNQLILFNGDEMVLTFVRK